MLLALDLTERAIGLAIEVLRATGPGMLEPVYAGCLCHEPGQANIAYEREAKIPVSYKGIRFDEGFRADILVDGQLIVAIRTVTKVVPGHDAQVLAHIRMSVLRLGSLFNFHARLLKDDLRRFIL